MVTCISECPLNSKNGILFASGCYDGNISVWDMEERNPIFSYECSNVQFRLFRGKYGACVGIQEPSLFLLIEMN